MLQIISYFFSFLLSFFVSCKATLGCVQLQGPVTRHAVYLPFSCSIDKWNSMEMGSRSTTKV